MSTSAPMYKNRLSAARGPKRTNSVDSSVPSDRLDAAVHQTEVDPQSGGVVWKIK